MQIKIFTIPIVGGESLTEEMNLFLRTKKVLQVEEHIFEIANGGFWCFRIKYLESGRQSFGFGEKEKVDYREVLSPAEFERFSSMREIRKKVASEEGIPAYAIWTDEEMSEIAKVAVLTLAELKKVKGIGEKKVEKYGKYFINTDSKPK